MKILDIYPHSSVCCAKKESVGYDMKTMHIHDAYEIYMALCSHVNFFVNNHVFFLEEGDVMLFTSNDLHKVSVNPNHLYRRCVITFSAEELAARIDGGEVLLSCFTDPSSPYKQIKLSKDEQAKILFYADRMMQENTSSEFFELEKWINLSQILILLCKAQKSVSPKWNSMPDSMLSQTIVSYIDQHFKENLSLDNISTFCFLNKSYLCRIFKQETGFHIHDYITYRRLSHAIICLQHGESVGNTAHLCGFGSDTSFISIFKKHLGKTPYQYAKNHLRKP